MTRDLAILVSLFIKLFHRRNIVGVFILVLSFPAAVNFVLITIPDVLSSYYTIVAPIEKGNMSSQALNLTIGELSIGDKEFHVIIEVIRGGYGSANVSMSRILIQKLGLKIPINATIRINNYTINTVINSYHKDQGYNGYLVKIYLNESIYNQLIQSTQTMKVSSFNGEIGSRSYSFMINSIESLAESSLIISVIAVPLIYTAVKNIVYRLRDVLGILGDLGVGRGKLWKSIYFTIILYTEASIIYGILLGYFTLHLGLWITRIITPLPYIIVSIDPGKITSLLTTYTMIGLPTEAVMYVRRVTA